MDTESSRHDSLGTILQDQNAEPCDIRLQYLRDITKNFSGEREIGRGGFGVVYKGVLRNGDVIAVKNLISMTEVQEKQFKNEVDNLMRVRHQNVVRFIGYCYETWMEYIEYNGKHIFAEKPQMLLCFEYMPNGSLDQYISGESRGLDWYKCYRIIKGICCGLHYLHNECQINASIIHLDLKPANILLDENMLPKIADFGLSKFLGDQKTRTHTTTLGGSLGYMAPEYLFQGMITIKVDIYSLGVIIIEMIAGCKISPQDTGTPYKEFAELVLKNWRNRLEAEPNYTSLEIDYQQIEVCLEIGLCCVKRDPTERPAISEIIERLDRLESTYCYVNDEERPPADEQWSIPNATIITEEQRLAPQDGQFSDESLNSGFIMGENSLTEKHIKEDMFSKMPGDATDPSESSKKKPVGILLVKVIRACHLRGKSSLYVKLKIAYDKFPYKTTTVKHGTRNPEWDEDFKFIVTDPETQALEIHVFNWEKAGKQEKMGMSMVALDEFHSEEPKTLDLILLKNIDPHDVQNEKFRGQLTLELTYKPFKEEEMQGDFESSNVVDKAPYGTPAGGGLLYVLVRKAKDLEGQYHTNPYVDISFRGEQRRTKVIKNNRNPRWLDEFEFVCEEPPVHDILHVEVLSRALIHRKESLGYIDIFLKDVINKKLINEKYHLMDSKNGQIQIELQWRTP